MSPLSLPDKENLFAVYGHVLKAIINLLTRAGVFLVSLGHGADGHLLSKGIASLAEALMDLQRSVKKMEDWVLSMMNNQNPPINQVQRQILPCTPQNPPSRLGPASTPSSAFSLQFTPLSPYDTPLSVQNAFLNRMRVPRTNQVPPRPLPVDFFAPLSASRMSTPHTYGAHSYPIDVPRSSPPQFWRPAPKAQNVKLMVPNAVRHRKKTGEEDERKASPASVTSASTPTLFG